MLNVKINQSSAPLYIQPPEPTHVTSGSGAANSYFTALQGRLASSIVTLYENLFPIATDYQQAPDLISDSTNLDGKQAQIIANISTIKIQILAINQISNIAASRIPTGFTPGDPNSGSVDIAGLGTATNPNAVLDAVNNIYDDAIGYQWVAAQSDYATLRDLLQPYFNF